MRFVFMILILLFANLLYSNQLNEDTVRKIDESWKRTGNFIFGLGQTSFTNWAAGGDNNINLSGSILYDFNYKKEIINWNSHIDSKYGTMVFLEKKPRKTNDQIHISSKLGYEIDSAWSFTMLFSFESQFTNGYKYPNDSVPISRFMAPGYIVMGLGLDFKPDKYLSVIFTPFTNKVTIVNDADLANKGSYGVEPALFNDLGVLLLPGRRFKNEPGGFLKFQFQYKFDENFDFGSRLELFSSYFNNPTSIDVRWNLNSLYKLSKKSALSFSIDLIYDEDALIKEDLNGDGIDEIVGPRTQVKENLTLGITMTL